MNRFISRIVRPARRGAFGLLETLLASGVLITVVGATVGLGAAAVRSGQNAADRQIAYHLANEGIEVLRQTRDARWVDGDNTTSWRAESAGRFGLCTEFPTNTQDHACGTQDTGASGQLELFYDAAQKKWQALYCDADAGANPRCNATVAQGATLGEEAVAPVAVDMSQDGKTKTEVMYLMKDGTIIDNNHGPNSTQLVNEADVARVFERKIRIRQVNDGDADASDGLCRLPTCDVGARDIGPQAVQVVAQVSWSAQGRPYQVESSSILTNWNPEF